MELDLIVVEVKDREVSADSADEIRDYHFSFYNIPVFLKEILWFFHPLMLLGNLLFVMVLML